MELTRTDAVFSRIAMVLFLCRNKSSQNDLKINGDYFWNIKNTAEKIKVRGATPYPRGWGRPLGARPSLVGPLLLHRHLPRLHIFTFGEKKIKDNELSHFTTRSRRQALISLGMADLESVRGSGEWRSSPSSSSTFLHHQFHDAHRRA